MRFIYCLLAILITTATIAQTPSIKPPAVKTPPVISDALRAKLFKAEAENVIAAQTAQAKSDALGKVIEEVKAACGKDYQLTEDKTGEPVCTPLPTKP